MAWVSVVNNTSAADSFFSTGNLSKLLGIVSWELAWQEVNKKMLGKTRIT